MPRFGVINERRHQLHEVIRLSGLNICIDDQDHPLIIKVASVSAARMQVYFIDNDEYFRRKFTLKNEKGEEFDDNDERSMFFCRGVLETVKKLGWQPDVIHCHGYMTGIMGLLHKKEMYGKDPHFKKKQKWYIVYTMMDSPKTGISVFLKNLNLKVSVMRCVITLKKHRLITLQPMH